MFTSLPPRFRFLASKVMVSIVPESAPALPVIASSLLPSISKRFSTLLTRTFTTDPHFSEPASPIEILQLPLPGALVSANNMLASWVRQPDAPPVPPQSSAGPGNTYEKSEFSIE